MHNSSMNNSFHQQFYQMFPVAPPSSSSQASSRSTTPVPGPPPPPQNCTMNRHLLQQQQHQHTLQHNHKNNPQKQLPPNPFRGLQIIQMPAIVYPCKVEGWLYIHGKFKWHFHAFSLIIKFVILLRLFLHTLCKVLSILLHFYYQK